MKSRDRSADWPLQQRFTQTPIGGWSSFSIYFSFLFCVLQIIFFFVFPRSLHTGIAKSRATTVVTPYKLTTWTTWDNIISLAETFLACVFFRLSAVLPLRPIAVGVGAALLPETVKFSCLLR